MIRMTRVLLISGSSFLRHPNNALPFTFGASTVAELGSQYASGVAYNQRLKARSTMPYRKWANLFKNYDVNLFANLATQLSEGAGLAGADTAGIQALWSEIGAYEGR
jgi:hypothetical protein